ncbi:methylated-DNA--[protein]-cysteine S-methyltransferase [Rubrobacter indicoceani]|uniref:methylated-DNA--[protein]-cysteine S-methyltransferase n=1 Tax=Rubrobacter indicoceani TaxID=2051957 RepID=UPI000E5BF037|nr:methylated-DNA--[protein]-cysteine S-methyltransferase [Rubrobacter indicoceani]
MNETRTSESIEATLRAAGERLSGYDLAAAGQAILADGADLFFTVDSSLGKLYVGYGTGGIKYVTPCAEDGWDFSRRYGEMFGRLVVPQEEGASDGLRGLVRRALAGERVEVPLDLSGRTEFQRRVLKVVEDIPRGEVRSYGWVAGEAGRPRASRAVGTIMANNPVPLIVPCHRVIRNDGSPGSYGFEPEKKVRLLRDEGVPLEEVARAPYVATPTTGIVCHTTCRHARRIKPENRRPFKNLNSALGSGFRPCKVCRPAVAA